MAGRATVSALAAWAGGPIPPGAGEAPLMAGFPFRTATFDGPQSAVAAALLLVSTSPHADDGGAIRIGIATGEPDAAAREASSIAAWAAPGSIVMTAGAMEALEHRLPDGMALRTETLMIGGRPLSVFALRAASEVVPHSLPRPSTRLIGRGSELREIRDLLREQRLVSLTGPPGSGKTRLALEIGRVTLGTFPDGVWFAALAPIQDPDLVSTAVAESLGLKEEAGVPMMDVVGRYLAQRDLLLIMDNFEHVLDAATSVAGWLETAPRLRVLATSRAPLHLSGEYEVVVPPLMVPSNPDDPEAWNTEAVQLFNERARAVAPDFQPDARTLPDIARICRRLDGLPLALELAAARAKALPAAAIRRRLEQSLELLKQSNRDAPARHRSLHAAVSWSHSLLSPAEQAALRRLSVFRGGWDLEAADAVTLDSTELGVDPLELMTSLLDESLIRRQLDVRTEPRYDMLETLREYGRERLLEAGEAEDTDERHARWFLELAERLAPSLTGRDQRASLDRLERESDNLRAALRWAIDRRAVELGMRLAAALWRFWQMRGHIGEGRQLLAELMAIDAEVDARVRARALSAAGSLAYWQNDRAAATGFYEASVELRRGIGDPAELASGLYDLGHALSVLGPEPDSARGRALETEALEIYRSLGDETGEAWLIWALALNSNFAGDHATAIEELARGIDAFRNLDDPFGLAWALTMHGVAAARLERYEGAAASLREALGIFAAVDDVSGIETVLEHLARLAMARGDVRRAIRLTAAAARVHGIGQTAIVEMGDSVDGRRLLPTHGLTDEEMDAARREGEAMTTAEAVEYALQADDAQVAAQSGLWAYVLGRMRAERGGVPVRSWGGEKAGSRQAQAIFAFLFDRGEIGVSKDEVTELLWPDLPIRRGDLAFHRTLGGLRSVLDEHRTGASSIAYSGGRYRLNPEVVAWSDVAAFEDLLAKSTQLDGRAAIDALEEARVLYRGDLFDDCPVYGDSSEVEERRAYLRGRFEDLLVQLGDRYSELGDSGAAAARYRQALAVNPTSPRATAGLARVGAVGRAEASG